MTIKEGDKLPEVTLHHMTEKGPKWFTEPAHSIDDPFGLSL